MENKTIKGYKGFDKDLKCRGFQYEVGKEYSTDKAVACETGFHCCENPFDVWAHYAPCGDYGAQNAHYAPCGDYGAQNRFCEVEADGDMDKSNEDKICCTHLKVKAEIGLQGLIKAGVKFILNRVKWDENKQTNTGDCSAVTNTGDRSAATNTGYCSAATNTGDWSAATNTGDCSAATNTGDRSAATNTGDRSAACVKGKESIAIVTGKNSKAKGALGCWLVLTERGEWDDKGYPIKEVKAFKVDGKEIKADTWYKLIDGKPVEVKEDE